MPQRHRKSIRFLKSACVAKPTFFNNLLRVSPIGICLETMIGGDVCICPNTRRTCAERCGVHAIGVGPSQRTLKEAAYSQCCPQTHGRDRRLLSMYICVRKKREEIEEQSHHERRISYPATLRFRIISFTALVIEGRSSLTVLHTTTRFTPK